MNNSIELLKKTTNLNNNTIMIHPQKGRYNSVGNEVGQEIFTTKIQDIKIYLSHKIKYSKSKLINRTKIP